MNRTLTVVPVDSVTTLNVSKPDKDGNVNCTGSVMADEPVRSASVQITWDKSHILITKTNANGQFVQNLQLPMGTSHDHCRFLRGRISDQCFGK